MSLRSPSRRAVVITVSSLSGVVALLLASGAWWWFATDRARAAAEVWIDGLRGRGWVVSGEPIRVSGWPFRARLRIDAPSVSGPGFKWTAETIKADVSLYTTKPPKLGAVHPDLVMTDLGREVSARKVDVRLVLTPGGRVGRAETSALEPIVSAPGEPAAKADRLDATVELPDVPPRTADEIGLTASAVLRAVVFDGDMPEAFKGGPRTIDARIRVRGVPPNADRAAIEAWTRDGGAIEIDRVAVDWGPSSIVIDGTAAFDKDLQPMGAGTITVRNANAALDAFAARLRPKAVAAARMAIDMLARTAASGENEVKLPITLQNHAVFLGPARVAKVPPLPW